MGIKIKLNKTKKNDSKKIFWLHNNLAYNIFI